MTDYPSIAAVGVITGVWPPVVFAAAAIFGGFLVAAIIPKDARGRIEGGVRGLVTSGWKKPPAAPAGLCNETPAATDPDATPGHRLEHAPEPEPLPEPETPELTAVASPGSADLTSTSDDVHAADGEQILGRYLRMDTASTAEGLEFTMEVPGLKESDLEIRLVGETIVITGRWNLDRTDKTFRVVEREFGPFSRFIKISEGVPLRRIQASLDRGLLIIFVPNPTAPVGKSIAINSTVRRIFDGDDAYELKIDLPGVDESDVDLAVRDGVLTITCREGPRAADAGDQAAIAFAPRLLESMALPAGVDADQIRAVLAKGVLTVTLPIAAGHRQRTIPLDSVREAAGSETRSSDIGAPPWPPAGGCCQSGSPFVGPGDPPFDFWSAGEILAGRSLHMGESIDRRF